MTSVVEAYQAASSERSAGVWVTAWRRLKNDRVGMASLAIVGGFLVLVLAAGLGLVASDWQKEVGLPDAPPSFVGPRIEAAGADPVASVIAKDAKPVDLSDIDPLAPKYKEWAERAAKIQISDPPRAETLPFGADRLGRDIIAKVIKGAEISIFVGVFAALLATFIGTVLGAIGGYFGGRANDLLEWVYNVFTAIPGILLIFAFAAVVGRGIDTVIYILGLTGWTGIYRLMRAEYLKHREREYVLAAKAIGVSHAKRMFAHILPNTSHVLLVQFSLLVVAFIKTEVILSFLGLGIQDGVSWGLMLAESTQEVLAGHFSNFISASVMLFALLMGFNLLADALQDAFDPKQAAQ